MPSALPSRPYRGTCWRLVEGQHVVSTAQLVDSLDEQKVLEDILERTKPAVPDDCAHLHYLMATPFRYGLYPVDSRFRRRGRTPGVFYASEHPVTAVAETVWSRLRFFAAAEGVPLPARAGQYTAFACALETDRAIDLTRKPLDANKAIWTDPDDYSGCLDLADEARARGAELIRYASVRHPDALPNLAVLACGTFAANAPDTSQTWRILLQPQGARVFRDFPRQSMEFRVDGSGLALS